jgi:hypothetical protein
MGGVVAGEGGEDRFRVGWGGGGGGGCVGGCVGCVDCGGGLDG